MINISSPGVTDLTSEKIAEFFLVNRTLKNLILLGNKFSNRGLEKMSRTIGKAKLCSLNLQVLPLLDSLGAFCLKLGFQANQVGDSGAVVLCESLMSDRNADMNNLELGLNRLGPPAAAASAIFDLQFFSLIHLCSFAVATLLELNFPLVSLELGWNNIGNEV